MNSVQELIPFTIPTIGYGQIIKGGSGSGNFHHQGIPGQQGGSQPQAIGHLAGTDEPDLAFTHEGVMTHPLLYEYTGSNPVANEQGNVAASTSFVTHMKENLAAKLAKQLGTSKIRANAFMEQWAKSSNDHSLQSLGMQKSASAEFGSFMAYWQQERYDAMLIPAREEFLQKFEKNLAKSGDGGDAAYNAIYFMKPEHVHPFQVQKAKEAFDGGLKPSNKEEALAFYDKTANEGMAMSQKALRIMQQDTQKTLEDAGIKSVRAYRGVQLEGAIPATWSQGSTVAVRNNAMSSWTLNKQVAEGYSNAANGVLLEAAIPADRIIAIPKTGIGNAQQWEVVMMGHKQRDMVKVVSHGDPAANLGHVAPAAQGVQPVIQTAAKPTAKPVAKAPQPLAEPKLSSAQAIDSLTSAKPSKPPEALGQLKAPPKDMPVFEAKWTQKDHPLVEAFAGKNPNKGFDDDINVSIGHRQEFKAALAENISKATGVTNSEASNFVRAWAQSSNDHALPSLVAQHAATEEFGIQMSDWQQKRYTDTLQRMTERFGESFAVFQKKNGAEQSMLQAFSTREGNEGTFPFQRKYLESRLKAGDIPKSRSDAERLFVESGKDSMAKTREVLRHMHNETQAYLKQAGMTELHAFRGVQFDDAVPKGWSINSIVKHISNAMSSWSISKRIANDFADGSHSVILEASVPISRVIAFPKTGYGCAHEWEIVVLGSAFEDESRIFMQKGTVSTKAVLVNLDEPRGRIVKNVASVQFGKVLSNKGGDGSGNFHHQGIPGHRGGSEPQGMDGGPSSSSYPVQNRGTVSGGSRRSTAGGSRQTVNLANSAHVLGRLNEFVAGSPFLSRAATSKQPLPRSFLSGQAGSNPGEQHLGEIMRSTGVDNNLPTKKNLAIGAKSLFMPISGKEELDAYMEKRLAEKGQRSASTGGGGGMFKPHPAPGANAHGQLKKDAKVADHKSSEKARQQVRNDTHGLLMSALQQAAQTGDYSQANALQVKYQLTGGAETFALLMGYQALDMGAQEGIVVLDRSALDIHPSPILGAHRDQGFGQTTTPRTHKARIVKAMPYGGKVVKSGNEGSVGLGHIGHAKFSLNKGEY